MNLALVLQENLKRYTHMEKWLVPIGVKGWKKQHLFVEGLCLCGASVKNIKYFKKDKEKKPCDRCLAVIHANKKLKGLKNSI